jgi:RNA polymerase sigma factor (sigma-70 family)
LLKALYSLPPGDFDLLMMRHVDHKSTEQIAITMGITEQTVKSRLLRALFSLRKSLSS